MWKPLPTATTTKVTSISTGKGNCPIVFSFWALSALLEEMNAAALRGNWKCFLTYAHNLLPVGENLTKPSASFNLLTTGYTVNSKLQINRLMFPLWYMIKDPYSSIIETKFNNMWIAILKLSNYINKLTWNILKKFSLKILEYAIIWPYIIKLSVKWRKWKADKSHKTCAKTNYSDFTNLSHFL